MMIHLAVFLQALGCNMCAFGPSLGHLRAIVGTCWSLKSARHAPQTPQKRTRDNETRVKMHASSTSVKKMHFLSFICRSDTVFTIRIGVACLFRSLEIYYYWSTRTPLRRFRNARNLWGKGFLKPRRPLTNNNLGIGLMPDYFS